jgi:DNA-binding XRE family transcriptional regulator
MSLQTITRNGKKFVLVEEAEYRRLRGHSAPALPEADARGEVPAVAYARASLARKFAAARKAAGLTQGELAKLAGVRIETVNRLENAMHVPDLRTVTKIDRALRRVAAGRTRLG